MFILVVLFMYFCSTSVFIEVMNNTSLGLVQLCMIRCGSATQRSLLLTYFRIHWAEEQLIYSLCSAFADMRDEH